MDAITEHVEWFLRNGGVALAVWLLRAFYRIGIRVPAWLNAQENYLRCEAEKTEIEADMAALLLRSASVRQSLTELLADQSRQPAPPPGEK